MKVIGIRTESLVNASDKGGYALTVITGITRHIHHLLTWRIANSPDYLVYYWDLEIQPGYTFIHNAIIGSKRVILIICKLFPAIFLTVIT